MSARGKDVRDRVLAAARALAQESPRARFGVSVVARRAGVSWPTARRHLGGQEGLARLLATTGGDRRLADTRARLVEAAEAVFTRDGFHGATMDQIGAEAGMTKGAVYWHFDGKRALVLALVDARLSRPPSPTLPAEVADAREALAAFLGREVESLAPRLLVELAALARDAEVRALLDRWMRRVGEDAAALVEVLAGHGACGAGVDSESAGRVVAAVAHGLLVERAVADSARGEIATVEQVSELLAAGLEAGSTKPRSRRGR